MSLFQLITPTSISVSIVTVRCRKELNFWFRSGCVSRLWYLSSLLKIRWEDGNSTASHCVRVAISHFWFMQVSFHTYCPRLLIGFFQIPRRTPTLTYILLRLKAIWLLCKTSPKRQSPQRMMPVSSVLILICDVLPFNRSHPSPLSRGVSILRSVSPKVTCGGATTNHWANCTTSLYIGSWNLW